MIILFSLEMEPQHTLDDQVLSHLFMPMRLPDSINPKAEMTIFHSFIQDINHWDEEGIVSLALKQFSDDIKQPPNINQLSNRITQSFIDENRNNNNNNNNNGKLNNVPLITYFKKSNCILVIHRPPTINDNNNRNNNNNLIQIYPTLDTFNAQTSKIKMATPICSFNIQDVNQLLDPVFLEYLVALRDTDQPPIMSYVKNQPSLIPVPNTILNWLIPSIPGCSYNDSTTKYSTPIIYKSIRPEILNIGDNLVWIRSPLWVGLKSLTHFLAKRYGLKTRDYKMALLSFKMDTLAKYKVNAQTTLEYIAHLARSCDKFKSKYQKKHPTTVFDFIKSIKEQCETLSTEVHQQWDAFCQVIEDKGQISTPINNICKGLKEYGKDQSNLVHKSLQQNIQSFPKNLKADEMNLDVKGVNTLTDSASNTLINYLKRPFNQLYQLAKRDAQESFPVILQTIVGRISAVPLETDNVSLVIILNIIEFHIFNIWSTQIFTHALSHDQQKCQDVFSLLYNLMNKYIKLSKPRYEKDAILCSRYILTSYTLVAILDRLTLDYCLLLDNKESRNSTPRSNLYSSVPPYVNISIFSSLLLQHSWEFSIVKSLETYFKDKRQCSKASIDNSIFSIDDNGFGEQWAEQFLQDKLKKELKDIEKKKEEKIKEYQDYKHSMLDKIKSYQSELLLYKDDLVNQRRINNAIDACYKSTLPIYFESIPAEDKHIQFKHIFEVNIPFYLSYPESSFIHCYQTSITCYGYKERGREMMDITRNKFQPNLCLSIPEKVKFSQLNWMIQSTQGIEENEVLSTQNMTPKGMLPDQYIRYGMLRVGPSLSIRNMIRFMEERNNLNGIHVLVMFYQLSMQGGATNRIGWNDDNVLQTLCHTADTIVSEGATNWEGGISMIVTVHFLTIAFNTRDNKPPNQKEQLDETSKMIIKVLEKCRLVLWNWITKLEELIQHELLNGSDTETAILRKRMVYTAIAIIMTFNIDNNNKQYIIQQTNYFQHIEYYFKSLIILDENTTSLNDKTRTLGSSCPEQPFLDIIFNQLSLIIYRQIPFIVDHFKDGKHFKCLNNIIRNDQEENDFKWEKGSSNLYYQFQIANQTIQFNIFDGTLLFNGTFDKRLPKEIIDNALYKSYFGCSIFQVKPTGNSIWTTNELGGGYNIEFSFVSSVFGVIQNRNNGERWLLLDPHLFSNLPMTLYRSYSHWINLATNEIEFRPPTFQQYKDGGGSDTVKFIGTPNGQIKCKSTGKSLLCFDKKNNQKLRSQIFKLFRLESSTRIHIFQNEASKLYKIHLNQYGLDFIVDCQNQQINSVQYSGYRLCEQQYIGTLVGLKTILVLEQNNASGTKKLILPHSTITLKVNKDCIGFNNAKSSITSLNHPSYFIYDIDQELKMIKSSDLTAHLHLCYSHIVTSSLFRDPLTGLRGMELAIILLKKFNNNMPLNRSQLDILSNISNISPKRVYDNQQQQKISISYPLLSPMISHCDGFAILVDGIKKSHQEMSFLYDSTQEKDKSASQTALALNHIAWSRPQGLYSPLCHIGASEPYSSVVVINPSPFDQPTKNVQRMASIIQSKNIAHLDNSFSPHSKIGSSTIHGLVFTENHCVPELQETNHLISIKLMDRNHKFDRVFSDWYLKLLKIAMETANGHFNISRFKFIITLFSHQWSGRSFTPFIDHFVLIAISKPLSNIPRFPQESSFVTPQTTFNQGLLERTRTKAMQSIRMSKEDRKKEKESVLKNILEQNIWDKNGSTIIAPNRPFRHLNHTSLNLRSLNEKMEQIIHQWLSNSLLNAFLKAVGNETKGIVYKREIEREPSYFNSFPKFKEKHPKEIRGAQENKIIDSIPMEYLDIWESGFDQQLESILSTLTIENNKRRNISFEKIDHFVGGLSHETHLEEELFKNLNSSKDSLKKHLIQSKFEMNHSQSLGDVLEELSLIIEQKLEAVWQIIQEYYNNPKRNENVESELDCIFKSCHSWIGCVPLTVYEDFSNHLVDLPDQIYQLIGVHILLQTYKQKIQKCKYLKGVDLVKELSHCRKTRQWLPKDYPTWLVFELEQSIWIRDTQAKIAIKLIDAQSNECVQLQMGEGKTSVILPIMCLAIPNGIRIARVNAIPSLLQTYIQDLQMRLGSSILNRPIHLYPFKRDIGPSISESNVQSILGNIEKCKQMNGIILCTPEHRLSFNLFWRLANDKLFDSMGNVIKWWDTNIFDIMDECDDLLSHRYQLLYPIGSKIPLDGGSDRWKVIEEVLSELKSILEKEYGIYEKYPFIRFTKKNENNQDAMKEVLGQLCDNLINKLPTNLKAEDLELVKQFVGSDEDTPIRNHRNARSMVEKLDKHQTRILVYRGLFSYEVLLHSLSKTWSKHYGIRSTASSSFKRDSTLLAVPFRAKDTPSERAEYGHPDFAIILTFLSYYNQGLSFNQFSKALDCLKSSHKNEAPDIYRSWTDYDPTIEEKYRDFKCVVKSDNQLIKHLHSLFKFNCRVINFWLNELVFPYEAKQYPSKLFANPWDLVYPKSNSKNHISCGFSGTNDTKSLYPRTIEQKDLVELEYTNVQVLNYILDQDDHCNKVHILVDDKKILQEIVKLNINNQNGHYFNILIDSGALMIGKSNEDVAKKWLKKESSARIDGALFFENDKLTTIDREGKKFIFSQSPLSDRLDRVLVYLDDYHTRGVDINLPVNSNGMLTVGNKITKEKLLQACMRMRKLGQGQTISILISKNLGIELGNGKGGSLYKSPEIHDILKWTIQNTIESITNSFVQWTFQGMMNARSKSAISLLALDNIENKESIFSRLVSFPETLSLYDMYSSFYQQEKGNAVVSSLQSNLEKAFKQDVADSKVYKALGPTHSSLVKEIRRYAEDKIEDQMIFSNMVDEEQEREFEIEVESEIERQLPPKVEPFIEDFKGYKWSDLLEGKKSPLDFPLKFLPIKDIFKNTLVGERMESQNDCFSPSILATQNFINTIIDDEKTKIGNNDYFVKQINYILVFWNGSDSSRSTPNMVLVSMKEANHLLKKLKGLIDKDKEVVVSIHQTIQKEREKQTEYFTKLSTRLPNNANLQSIDPLLNQLNVLNGSKYFDNLPEIYQFLGIFRCDSKTIMSQLINKGIIDQFGFVYEHVNQNDINQLTVDKDLSNQLLSIIKTRRFTKCPIDLLEKNLVLQRIYYVGFSHIEKIINNK
ncbi:hypothetical protein DFA_00085 [Cavenderia fasciculata]|uniref:ubiquitinyl hydrolase 1 n=1 Tax=Cavenderia fasciculata TaxID=261658 RepID=F4PXJ7_CACFS|nr:uncharacterized protein DFA_00085 [Cavenderia fasciculata]EGG19507.1 hypothetical protein DFA_00085 [Cavenderia fasciculata]|eukprot:XP_004357801.1 hypothetical protein DFA_00085 [Cavenderia fasciculata]